MNIHGCVNNPTQIKANPCHRFGRNRHRRCIRIRLLPLSGKPSTQHPGCEPPIRFCPDQSTNLHCSRSRKVSGSGSFSYTASVGGLAYLVFDNSFSTFSSKSVSAEYSVAGVQSSQSFTVGAGDVNTIGVSLNGGQTVSGTFTASGGSGNDVDFSITLSTCSQTIPFTANLVDSGGANGYAVVSLQIQSSSNVATTGGSSLTSTSNTAGGSSGFGPLVQNGTVFSDRYYVEKGQQVPITGSATVLDCGLHTFAAVISQQQKA